MKSTLPKFPTFAKLTPKAGYVRGYVKDTSGKPLAGAKIGVRATAVGGFYSGSSATSDVRGYYEVKVPWGAAEFYCAGYTINYGQGRAAMGLHPADGSAGSFPSAQGAVENWVLLSYGIADRDGVSENPYSSLNYYGGSLVVDFDIAENPYASDEYLPLGSEIELTFTPVGKLIDGSQGRSMTFHKKVEKSGWTTFRINNIPVGTYQVKGRLLTDGTWAPIRLVETGPKAPTPFGFEPKDARGQATLTFRPSGAKPETALAQHGNWDSLSLTLKK